MIIGIGTDIVDIDLFREILNDPISVFRKKHFTEQEIYYCTMHEGHDSVEHFAGFYAAKEALVKACMPSVLRKLKDVSPSIDYTKIEVISNAQFGPKFNLHAVYQQYAEDLGVSNIWLSISHEKKYASAMVVAEANK